MQNGLFQNKVYYVIVLQLLMHSCVSITNVAAGKGGTYFNCFIYCWVAQSVIIHHDLLHDLYFALII